MHSSLGTLFIIIVFQFCTLKLSFSQTTAASCDKCFFDHHDVKVRRENESLNEFVDRIFAGYHPLYRPLNLTHPEAPTIVSVNMYVNSFGHISVRDMEYSVDVMLRQRWNDPRLQFANHTDNIISLGYNKDKMWTPDLFFRNSKHSKLHIVTKPNYLIFLSPNGDILFSQKVSLTLSCPMSLRIFPMDTQNCSIEIGSFGYRLNDLDFVWLEPGNHHNNLQLNSELNLNEFHKPEVNTIKCIKKYTTTGGFACIRANLILKRKFGFYLIYTYLPSILIVGISWLSFFIDFTVVPARITLGLLSMLALMTQSAATIQSLPRVSYIKALDVWLFSCLAFVVIALVEFAIVSAMCKEPDTAKASAAPAEEGRSKANSASLENSPEKIELNAVQGGEYSDDGEDVFVKNPKRFRLPQKVGYQVDRAFLVGFPAAFTFFNLVYWIGYLNS